MHSEAAKSCTGAGTPTPPHYSGLTGNNNLDVKRTDGLADPIRDKVTSFSLGTLSHHCSHVSQGHTNKQHWCTDNFFTTPFFILTSSATKSSLGPPPSNPLLTETSVTMKKKGGKDRNSSLSMLSPAVALPGFLTSYFLYIISWAGGRWEVLHLSSEASPVRCGSIHAGEDTY